MATSRSWLRPRWFRARPRLCLGVDIGADALKVALVEVDDEGRDVFRVTTRPTPAGAMERFSVVSPARLGPPLRDAARELGADRCAAAVCLPAPIAMVRRLSIPHHAADSLDRTVAAEMRQLTAGRQQEVCCDFQVTGDTAAGDGIEVVLVATRRDVVEGYVEAVARASLVPAVVDLDYFALQNSAPVACPAPINSVVLLLGADDRYAALNLVADGRSVFTTEFDLGEPERTPGGGADPDRWARFCDEVHHSVHFYCPLLGERRIDHVLLSGRAARSDELREGLAARLSAPVAVFGESAAAEGKLVPAAAGLPGPEFSLAVGLARREVSARA